MAETGSVTVTIDDEKIKERMRDFLAQAWDEGWDHAWTHARDECREKSHMNVTWAGVYQGIPNPYRHAD